MKEVTAQRMVEIASREAVVARLAPICVFQSTQDFQQAQKLGDLKGFNSSVQRARFVSEPGWATIPGEASPDENVAAECARQLLLTVE